MMMRVLFHACETQIVPQMGQLDTILREPPYALARYPAWTACDQTLVFDAMGITIHAVCLLIQAGKTKKPTPLLTQALYHRVAKSSRYQISLCGFSSGCVQHTSKCIYFFSDGMILNILVVFRF